MSPVQFCAKCGAQFESRTKDSLCLNCRGESGKTRTCIMCGGLIQGTSSVYLCLRCQKQTERKPSGPAAKSSVAAVTQGPAAGFGQETKKVRVLVIDDEPALCQLIRLRLEAKGYEIFTAMDGREGYREILEKKPDLVVSDIMMPNMTGYDLLHKLKKEAADIRKTPVIIMTSKNDMKQFFSDWEIHAFLVKPFEPADLEAKIGELIERAKRFSEK